jgi:hypothetical protein
MRSALPFYVAAERRCGNVAQVLCVDFKYALDDADAMHLAASFVHRVAQLAQRAATRSLRRH